MSLKGLRDKAMSAANILEATFPTPLPKQTKAVTVPGAALLFQEQIQSAENRAKIAEEELRQFKKQEKGAFEVEISKLVEKPNRRRRLSVVEYRELSQNLQENQLIHPIRIRPIENDIYEIISGHNRVEIFKTLNRTKILAVEMSASDEEADRYAFFANLMQTSLTDFEKYEGFLRMQEQSFLTLSELASISGLPKSTISSLMSFGKLPKAAIALISKTPKCIGMNLVAELSRIYVQQPQLEEKIIEAVSLLADEKITQSEALKYCKQSANVVSRTKPILSRIKSGSFDYCTVRSLGNRVSIEFKNEEHRHKAEQRLSELLKSIATGLST